MSYLLDTHTLLWLLDNNPRLSAKACEVLAPPDSSRFISICSFWELAIKKSMNKVEMSYAPADLMEKMPQLGISILGIKPEYVRELETLPYHHRDPFDRLIIVTALVEKLIVVSADDKFKNYHPVKTLW